MPDLPSGIRQRGPGQYQVRIRLRGFPSLEKTFPDAESAIQWQKDQLAKMQLGQFEDTRKADKTILKDLIGDYVKHVVPGHRGHSAEKYRLEAMQGRSIASRC